MTIIRTQEELGKYWKRVLLLQKFMMDPPRVEVGTTPKDIVYQEGTLRLFHYHPMSEVRYKTPILVVYALINKPYILDLQPRSSVVQALLKQGFDVYLIDWGTPRAEDHALTLNDYVNGHMDRCIDHVLEESHQKEVSILGYCMGGTMSVMYTALHPNKVKNLIVMASALNFDTEEGLLNIWSKDDYFDVDRFVDTYGNVPPEFLNGGYLFLDPVGNFYFKYLKFFERIEDEEFIQMFLRMEKWVNDGIPLAGETFREFIKNGYQRNLLIKNEWKLDGETVNLKDIKMPVLNIVGEYDNLVPPGNSLSFNDQIGSRDKRIIIYPTGHIGLSVSSRSHKDLWPQVGKWLADRSDGLSRDRRSPVNPKGKTSKKGKEPPISKGKRRSSKERRKRPPKDVKRVSSKKDASRTRKRMW